MPVEEQVQRGVEHRDGLGMALGASVEAGKIVADRSVGGFDEMRLRLCLGVRFGNAVPLEGQPIAGVRVGEDGGDVGNGLSGQPVEGDGAVDALVADVVRNNATLSPAISSPYDGPALFFWTKV